MYTFTLVSWLILGHSITVTVAPTDWGPPPVGSKGQQKKVEGFLIYFTLFFMATPAAYGNTQARDWIWAAAATYAEAAAMPDSFTHCTRLGI